VTVGHLLEISTIIASLLTSALLASKGRERYGYLVGFCTLPLWVITEAWYGQWVYFFINPVYFIIWGQGLYNHWRVKEKKE